MWMKIRFGGIWLLWLVLGVTLALAWVFWPLRVAELVTLVTTLLGLASRLLTRREPLSRDAAVRYLHDEAKRRWQVAARSQRLLGSAPFTVPWTVRGAVQINPLPLLEQARRARRDPLPARASIVEQYRAVESGRLVIVGHEGAGKTSLLLQLVAQLLERPSPADDDPPRAAANQRTPIPVMVEITHWDGIERLDSWLVGQLVDLFPKLGRPCETCDTAAERLIKDERVHVLAVLDAVDELRADRLAALVKQLNSSFNDIPVILAGRSDRLRATDSAHLPAFRLDEAAVLTIEPLCGKEQMALIGQFDPGKAEWYPVLERLDGDDVGPLAELLSTPSMVRLALTVYDDNNDADRAPKTLLQVASETAGQSDAAVADVRARLLDRYPAAAFGLDDDPGVDRRHARRLTRYLRFLAAQLAATQRHDLGWWELADRFEQRILRGIAAGAFWALAALPELVHLVRPWHAGALWTVWVPPLLVAFLVVYAVLPRPSQYTRRRRRIDVIALRVGLGVGCAVLAVEFAVVFGLHGWDAALASVGRMLLLYVAVVVIANLPVQLSTWVGDRIRPRVSQPIAVLHRERARALLLGRCGCRWSPRPVRSGC
ncbi:hypothetical protein Athai_21480 [Actinocatenispora thailandica]|uniref:ORC1/DEAH AAA+ ATPase domain-containing protein n=2 Tax=Actinocatenispora thailandica TaxID=227318 RepID=A0A7R7DMU9_9ACTN|nr:hypothetical protein Athai_21480 [Actinocatenispora thailandica]